MSTPEKGPKDDGSTPPTQALDPIRIPAPIKDMALFLGEMEKGQGFRQALKAGVERLSDEELKELAELGKNPNMLSAVICSIGSEIERERKAK